MMRSKALKLIEQWNFVSIEGGKTGGIPASLFAQTQEQSDGKPKNGNEVDALIKKGEIPNDTGPVYSGKSFEPIPVTKDGNLIHSVTKNPVPKLYVGEIQIMNGAPNEWVNKPISFLGRRIWAFKDRGYAYEVTVNGKYGILSLNGMTDKSK